MVFTIVKSIKWANSNIIQTTIDKQNRLTEEEKKQIRKNACWVSKHAMNWTVKQEGEWDWEKISTKTGQHGSFALIENMDTDEMLVVEKTNNIN